MDTPITKSKTCQDNLMHALTQCRAWIQSENLALCGTMLLRQRQARRWL
jgi:hypothetical protein